MIKKRELLYSALTVFAVIFIACGSDSGSGIPPVDWGNPPPPAPEIETYNSYLINCPIAGEDPFAASHSNFEVQFEPELHNGILNALSVELYSACLGSETAYVEVRNTSGTLLSSSNSIPVNTIGWLEFPLNQDLIINSSNLKFEFTTPNSGTTPECPRTYNCESVELSEPFGFTAFGNGLSDHMVRAKLKIMSP